MARFDERSLQWTDVLGRFEAHSHQTHLRDALAVTSRLKDEGRRFWPDGSAQLSRWEEGCTDLWTFLNNLGARRDVESQDLTTAMREFIQEFEHHTGRMYQMLYGATETPEEDERMTDMFEWFNLVFRISVYALLSGWIPAKHDEGVMRMTVDMEIEGDTATVKVSQESERREMTIPKKYRRAVDRI